MQNLYETCYYGGMIVAILLLIVTVVLFFVLKIPKVWGELSGSTARKGVKNLKEKGTREEKGDKEPRHYSQRTGAIKTRVTDDTSGGLSKKENTTTGLRSKKKRSSFEDGNKTEFLGEDKITAAVTGDEAETAVLSSNAVDKDAKLGFVDASEEETAVLNEAIDEEATAVLGDASDEEATAVLNVVDEEATAVLADADEEATEVLSSDDDAATEVLSNDDDDAATEVLSSEDDGAATEVLTSDEDEEATQVLTSDGVGMGDFGETSVLTSDTVKVTNKKYVVLYNALEVHTSESL